MTTTFPTKRARRMRFAVLLVATLFGAASALLTRSAVERYRVFPLNQRRLSILRGIEESRPLLKECLNGRVCDETALAEGVIAPWKAAVNGARIRGSRAQISAPEVPDDLVELSSHGYLVLCSSAGLGNLPDCWLVMPKSVYRVTEANAGPPSLSVEFDLREHIEPPPVR